MSILGGRGDGLLVVGFGFAWFGKIANTMNLAKMVQGIPRETKQTSILRTQQEEAAFSIIAMRSLFFIILLSLVPSIVTGGSIYDDRPYNTLQFTPNVTHRHDLCDRQVCDVHLFPKVSLSTSYVEFSCLTLFI